MQAPILLKDIEDYELALEQTLGFTSETVGCQKLYHAPKELGEGYFKVIYPTDDVMLSVYRLKLKYPIAMHYEDFNSQFEATYCMKGSIAYVETGVADTGLNQHDMGIFMKSPSRGMTMFPSGEEIFAVAVLARNQFFDELPFKEACMQEQGGGLPSLADTLLKPQRAGASLNNLFLQLAEKAVDVSLQPFFYEGAAKFVLSSLWQNFIVEPLKGAAVQVYRSEERSAIYAAKEILSDCYQEPPTIPQLAKMVSLNEYKLKSGFRNVFHQTIYEFVREKKMENARVLLEDRELSISQIAYEVGYLNTSHFARAFRNAYGMNPREYRLTGK